MQLVINSKFRPFTYDELIKPMLQYKEAYDKAEADYSNLAAQTEQWKNIADQTQSPKAYAMYSKYANDLEKATDDFSRGMTLQNRSQLLNMKKRYAGEITPIAKASEALDKALAFRADIKAKIPGAVFEDENPTSLDPYLNGGKSNNNYWDGDAALKRVAAKAESLGKALYSDATAKVFLNGQQYQISQLNGYSPAELTQILLQPENINTEAGKEIRKIIDDELDSIDLDKYSDTGKAQINNIISTGMYAGLAKPQYQYVANGEYMSKAERDASSRAWASYKLQKASYDMEKEKYDISMGKKPYFIDDNGKEYYSNGNYQWTVEDGIKSSLEPVKKPSQDNQDTSFDPIVYSGDDEEDEVVEFNEANMLTINASEVPKAVLEKMKVDLTARRLHLSDVTFQYDGDNYRMVPKASTPSNSDSDNANIDQ